MGSGFAKKKKEAKAFQEKFLKMQEEMKAQSVEGSAGGGRVTLILNGEHKMEKLIIKPECVDRDDIEGLQDLIVAAYHDALRKMEKNLPDMSGGLPSSLSGFGF